MPISTELTILIVACRLYFKTATLSEWNTVTNESQINWNQVSNLAAWHQVRPLLFEALRQYKPENLPNGFFQKLQDFCRQLAIENLSRVRQTQDLVSKLEEANIKTVLHKGVHYASFYKSVAHREFGDIDLLISPKDIKKATNLMQDWHYSLDLDYDEDANVVDLDYHSAFIAPKNTGLSAVEIHWKPNIKTQLNTEDIILNLEKVNIYNFNLPIPNDQSTFQLMVTHHGIKEHWHKLKYLSDLSSLLPNTSQEINWVMAQKANLSESLKEGIELVNTILEIDKKTNINQYQSALQNRTTWHTDNADYSDNYRFSKKVQDWLQQANCISTENPIVVTAKRSTETFFEKTSRSIKKYQVLSPTTQSYLLHAAIVILTIKIGLNIFPYSVFKKWYDKLTENTLQKQFADQDFKKATWAIRVVSARWPWRATCLPQALTFKYLHRQDSRLQLQIGVNKSASGQFQAHAWVEKDGKILIGETPESFKPLWEWSSEVHSA
jgi:hypothetical protein